MQSGPSSARRRILAGIGIAAGGALVLSGCGLPVGPLSLSVHGATDSTAVISVKPSSTKRKALPNKPVVVAVDGGRIESVRVLAQDGEVLEGSLSTDGATWTSDTSSLGYGRSYQVAVTAVDVNGVPTAATQTVETLKPKHIVTADIHPTGTVGVGMPVFVDFDQPVTDRRAAEARLTVYTDSATPIEGAWAWNSETEVVFRPETYWPANTNVLVTAKLDGVKLGQGLWGGENTEQSFRIADSVIMRVDARTLQMGVYKNGELLRTLPVTTGRPGPETTTRSGIKVLLTHERRHQMVAPDGEYNLLAEYAMRVTWSGEFLHAAPWSEGEQGSAAVSHGCVGMSTEDAAWLFGITRVGDVVEVTGTDRAMEDDNGIAEWNHSFSDWTQDSELGPVTTLPMPPA